MDWLAAVRSIFFGVLGGSATVYGVSRFFGKWWLEKQKANYSKELEEFRDSLQKERQRLQAEIDRSVFVTRAHFETEYLAMKEVAQRLAQVKMAFLRLNPPDASVEMTASERTQHNTQLAKANEEYWAKLEEWGVFLVPDLYDDFERCHIGATAEVKRVESNNPFEKDKALNAKYFWNSYSQACQKLRDRIKSLAVMPGT